MALEKATITNTVSGGRIVRARSIRRSTRSAARSTTRRRRFPGCPRRCCSSSHGEPADARDGAARRHLRGTLARAAMPPGGRPPARRARSTDLMNIDRAHARAAGRCCSPGARSRSPACSPGVAEVHHVPPDGVPVRARLQVTFNEFRNIELEAKEIKRETADYSKRHVVAQGETLSAIAAASTTMPHSGGRSPFAIASTTRASWPSACGSRCRSCPSSIRTPAR